MVFPSCGGLAGVGSGGREDFWEGCREAARRQARGGLEEIASISNGLFSWLDDSFQEQKCLHQAVAEEGILDLSWE